MELDIQKRMCCRSGTRSAMVKLAQEMGSWLPRQKDSVMLGPLPRGSVCSSVLGGSSFLWNTDRNSYCCHQPHWAGS